MNNDKRNVCRYRGQFLTPAQLQRLEALEPIATAGLARKMNREVKSPEGIDAWLTALEAGRRNGPTTR